MIGTWCILYLIAALTMLLMSPYSLDEFVAMGQFLVDARRKGKPFWRTFWMGDAMRCKAAVPMRPKECLERCTISGILLIALAIPRGSVKDSYAGWDRYVV